MIRIFYIDYDNQYKLLTSSKIKELIKSYYILHIKQCGCKNQDLSKFCISKKDIYKCIITALEELFNKNYMQSKIVRQGITIVKRDESTWSEFSRIEGFIPTEKFFKSYVRSSIIILRELILDKISKLGINIDKNQLVDEFKYKIIDFLNKIIRSCRINEVIKYNIC